ncbi:hypothetical protein K0040_17310 [Terrisporobacter petrolearius]|uniref:hypothetical protein n=1 Tax=Terrisporobacter petrolearius TaxID=1460447 RepID=UPI001D16BA0E|nr:hypothetical protein [Terrisporobacter petrolearius]MCC3866017.1 hypothetical protein [Terrisporobacter petrolearius]
MSNYYEYCRSLSINYYPKIYNDIIIEIKKLLKETPTSVMLPFPSRDDFDDLVNKVYLGYKEKVYKDMNEGEIYYIHFCNDDLTRVIKDLISILLINILLDNRKMLKNYPCYY